LRKGEEEEGEEYWMREGREEYRSDWEEEGD
jgi:hypothetical protein